MLPLTVRISTVAFTSPPPHHHAASVHFLFIMLVTWSPQRELSMMNQFQALFECFLTIDGVPALTFCNEVRSRIRRWWWWGGSPQQKVSVNEWADWNKDPQCLGKFNLPLKEIKGNRREEMRRGWGLKWQLREDDRRNSQTSKVIRQIEPLSEDCPHHYMAWVYCVFMFLISRFWLSLAGVWAGAAVFLFRAAWHSICLAALSKMSLPCIRTILIHPLTRPSVLNGSF